MAHQIATSLCWNEPIAYFTYPGPGPNPVALFVISLDANGNLNVYQQLPGGNWSKFPPPTAPTTFISVVGVPNFIIALGVDKFLYISVFAQGGWSAFSQLPQPINTILSTPQPISDFSAVWFPGNIMIVSVVDNNVGQNDFNIGLYSCCLDYSGGNVASPVSGATWYFVLETTAAVATSGPAIPALSAGWYTPGTFIPTIPLAAILPDSSDVGCWYNNNGSLSNPYPFTTGNPAPLYVYSAQDILTAILLTIGANNTLQLIILMNGQPWLFTSPDGINWTQLGNLLPSNVSNPPSFNKIAAGLGNSSNLQVVALGNNGSGQLPYLFWQYNVDSSWSLFQFDSQNGGPVGALNNPFTNLGGITPVDLAIGLGWNGASSALQVAYLGSDYNIYLSWQDNEGNWYSYAGHEGTGLP